MVSIKLALPKGHLWSSVKNLLDRAGYGLRAAGERSYSIRSNDPEIEMRIHRAQNIAPLVEEGKYDLGVTGLDWILEHHAEVEELMDLGVGRVKVVVAVPQRYGLKEILSAGQDEAKVFSEFIGRIRAEGKSRIIAASEYENLTKELCGRSLGGFPYRFIRSYGATETFIEVADLIVDCAETGETLRKNGWDIVHELFSSTARVIANKRSLQSREKKDKIEGFITLIKGAKGAEGLKLLKMNVSESDLEEVVKILPAMKSPTISRLYGGKEPGYAVEVAVREDQVVQLIPILKKKGVTDILEIDIKKAVK